MRYVFAIILGLHGLIHLMGFVKAFYLTDINKQVLGISKPIGSIWLIAFILFIISVSQFLTHKKWFYVAFLAVFISQILIIMTWKEAKYGTIINIIIFLVSISAFGNHRFEKMIQKESNELLTNLASPETGLISAHETSHLPEIVKKWLINSGVVGNEKISSVYLKQIGKMRIKPNTKWSSFTAEQYFDTTHPAFIWTTKVDAIPLISVVGRDKLYNGEGAMLIKLAGVIPVVNQSNNEKINQGAMVRYLAELCWFPQATIQDYVHWETINETSVNATFTYKNQSVSGLFSFTEQGDLIAFEADRYYGGEAESKLEKWRVDMLSYKVFNGIKIPNKSKVTWKLEEGDFHWLTLEIIDMEYNTNQ